MRWIDTKALAPVMGAHDGLTAPCKLHPGNFLGQPSVDTLLGTFANTILGISPRLPGTPLMGEPLDCRSPLIGHSVLTLSTGCPPATSARRRSITSECFLRPLRHHTQKAKSCARRRLVRKIELLAHPGTCHPPSGGGAGRHGPAGQQHRTARKTDATCGLLDPHLLKMLQTESITVR